MPALVAEQIQGAEFLASRKAAFLADEAGFGKTAQAVAACDLLLADSILVLTTASARANWLNEFEQWAAFNRSGAAIFTTTEQVPSTDIVVVAWSNFNAILIWAQITKRRWRVLIVDEAHYAANIVSDIDNADAVVKRTLMLFGKGGLIHHADYVWLLTGTPIPNAPDDAYPALRGLWPRLLGPYVEYKAFVEHFCETKRSWVQGRAFRKIIGGKNELELRQMLAPIMLRRKLTGLPPLRYSTYHLYAEDLPDESDLDAAAIIAAAEVNDTEALEMHLGTIRRLTGEIKARATVEVIADELRSGLDKVVLFAWHHETIDILREGLAEFGVTGIDGRVPAEKREAIKQDFQTNPATRVFVAQIQAASEAITLTAANQCFFVEISFVPSHMAQAVKRIYRRTQTRPCLCRVAALRGSIDEALMRIVTRKVESIRLTLDED